MLERGLSILLTLVFVSVTWAGAEGTVNEGTQISFGFGGADPITYWRATEGDITGGQYVFDVIPEPTMLVLLGLGGLVTRRSSKHQFS